jgi:tetratricopeptide (TPR) repeat protein
MGQHAKAEPLYKRGLAIWETKLGKDLPDVADALHNLALLYKEMGQYAKAEPLYQRSLGIYEAKFGQEHLRAWFANLARVLEPGRAFYVWAATATAAATRRRSRMRGCTSRRRSSGTSSTPS